MLYAIQSVIIYKWEPFMSLGLFLPFLIVANSVLLLRLPPPQKSLETTSAACFMAAYVRGT